MSPSRVVLLVFAVAASACATAHAPRVPAVEAEPTAASPGTFAAFVIVTSRESVLVPVDSTRPVLRADGLYLYDESDGSIVRPAPAPEAIGRARCAGAPAPGGCRLPRRIRTDGDEPPTLDPSCACFETEATPSCEATRGGDDALDAWSAASGVTRDQLLARRRSAARDDDGAYDEAPDDEDCVATDSRPVSLHAGVLYAEGDSHETCGGMNIYGVFSEAEPLTSDARVLRLGDAQQIACDPNGAFLDGWATPSPARAYRLVRGHFRPSDEDADPDDDAAALCRDFARPDGEVAFRRGSHVVVVGADVDASGGGARFSGLVPADGDHCTSADPCGPVARFEAASSGGVRVPVDALSVANDGTAALAILDDRAALYLPGEVTPVRVVPFEGTALGIRHHADARPLARALTEDAARMAASAAHASTATPSEEDAVACGEDLDCRATLGCLGVCVERRCVLSADECAVDRPCAAGDRCHIGICEALSLHPNDATFEDRRGGTGFLARGRGHLRAGRLDAAEAAFAAGLSRTTDDRTRAASLHALGLVAEARGATWLARLYFEASLVLRPDAAVARTLDALGGPLDF